MSVPDDVRSVGASGAPDHVAAIATRAELAEALLALRERAGLTVRQLARQLDAPVATVADYLSGRHLPGPSQRARFVGLLAACGVEEPLAVESWLAALARARRSSDGRRGRSEPPYRGLEPFGERDAARFFGREEVTGVLLGRLRSLWRAGESMAILVGASGVGKTSVLHAGVLAAVRHGGLHPSAVTPGAGASAESGRPWSAAAVTPVTGPPGVLAGVLGALGEPSLLVVDQVEELLSPEVPAEVRRGFLDRVAAWSSADRLVLFGLRADFSDRAAREPVLAGALRRHQVLLGPMDEDEIRRASTEPARAVGAPIEPGLVEALLGELAHGAGPGAYEPGALPLLSLTLRSTWQRSAPREGLTLAAYREGGGLRGAVAQRAEELYEALEAADQELARRLLLRLVRVSEDVPLARRRAPHGELRELDGATPGGSMERLLERLVEARLVTVDAEGVAISHDTVLEAWPRLAGWIATSRSDLCVHHELLSAARSWEEARRDEALLLRGSRLAAATEWAADAGQRALLGPLERALIEDSLVLERREQRGARRQARWMRQLFAPTVALALAATALAGYALTGQETANTAWDQALSRELAIEARQLASTGEPNLAMQLALAGYRISPTVAARSTLVDATAGAMPTRLVGPPGPDVVATDASGRLLAIAPSARGDVDLEVLRGGRPRLVSTVPLGRGRAKVLATALSPNGRLLASGGTATGVVLDEVANPSRPRQLAVLGGLAGTVHGLAFASGGNELVAAGGDGTLRRWYLDASSGKLTGTDVLRASPGTALKAVAISPDGRLVVAGGSNGVLVAWKRGETTPTRVAGTGRSTIEALAFSPSGQVLVSGGADGVVRRFTVSAVGELTVVPRPVSRFRSTVEAVVFSRDGSTLAAGDAEGALRLLSSGSGAELGSLREPYAISSLGFSQGGHALLTGDGAGVVRIWPLPLPAMVKAPAKVRFLGLSRARPRLVAAISGGSAGAVQFWSLADPRRPTLVSTLDPPAGAGPVAGPGALSPDGRLLAVANAAAEIQLYDVAEPRHPRIVGAPLSGSRPRIEQLAFSPNGKVLVAGDDSGAIHRWDLADPARPVALSTLRGPGSRVLGVAESPSGRLLAAASADDHVWIWDVARPRRPHLVAKLGGFTSDAVSATFSPNGRILAVGGADRTVRLFDVSDPARPHLLVAPLTGPAAHVFQVALSPDGRTLAAATTAGTVWLWDVAAPARPLLEATLHAASGALLAVAFTPDGRTLLASGTDAVVHRWTLDPVTAAKAICAAAGTPIRPSEWAEYAQGAQYRPPCP